MKRLYFLLAAFVGTFLTSCGKFTGTDESVWGDGLIVLPILTALASVVFFYTAFRASKSNSTQQIPGQGTKDNTGNVPIYQSGRFWFGVGFLLATIGIVVWQNIEK